MNRRRILMKKILSIVLAVVMMFSASMIAFAADGSTLELGKDYTVTVKDNAVTYTFIAPEDGAYSVSASIAQDHDCEAYITIENDEFLFSEINLYYYSPTDEDDFSYSNVSSNDVFMVKGGTEVTVSVNAGSPYYDIDESELTEATVSFKIEIANDLREIKIGESYITNGGEYFLFKPTEDGFCDIWSHSCPYISVMTIDGDITSASQDFYTGFPADLPFYYEAGKIYGIYVDSNYDKSGNPIDSEFNVVDALTIYPDVIEAEDVTVVWGKDAYVDVEVYPLGSVFNCGAIDCQVGNEKIATVEFDPLTESYVVHGKRPGTTTLTITETASGVTAEVEVEVITRTTNFFRTVFNFISGIFDFISGLFNSIGGR